MDRMPIVAGNWKMNLGPEGAAQLVQALLPGIVPLTGVERVLCPPAISLDRVAPLLKGTPVRLGAQHMHWEEAGAFTGEISPGMVKEICEYVIIGHSERRAMFGETDETVRKRVLAALAHGLVPIVCVGETAAENEAGETARVVARQVRLGLAGLDGDQASRIVLAYEPVWAIGTGKAATPEGANAVLADVVRPALAALFGDAAAQSIRIQYGGSVTGDNAAAFFAMPEIDGALVGGASLKPGNFARIVAAAQR
jgi:triosephosphate isomerase